MGRDYTTDVSEPDLRLAIRLSREARAHGTLNCTLAGLLHERQQIIELLEDAGMHDAASLVRTVRGH